MSCLPLHLLFPFLALKDKEEEEEEEEEGVNDPDSFSFLIDKTRRRTQMELKMNKLLVNSCRSHKCVFARSWQLCFSLRFRVCQCKGCMQFAAVTEGLFPPPPPLFLSLFLSPLPPTELPVWLPSLFFCFKYLYENAVEFFKKSQKNGAI